MSKKQGRQTPTQSYLLRCKTSCGPEAVALYERTGRTAQKWQAFLIWHILGLNREGLFVHSKFGYAVPRRNGKNEVVVMREMWGLSAGEHILHTAHRTTTSHAAWERLGRLLADAGFVEGEDFTTTKQYGLEKITMKGTGGEIHFRTRSTKGGLGEGFDLLVIDEAQEYTHDQESALQYVVSDAKNPQTIFCGTPPTATSSGTVFMEMRRDALAGDRQNTGWCEWSVEGMTDVQNRAAWYETNPSLGTILTERKIQDEINGDDVDFNVQRLGLWLSYSQKSAISRSEWELVQAEELPEFTGPLYVGVKYGRDDQNAALSIAVRCTDGRIFLEAIDCRSVRDGNDWIIGFLSGLDAGAVYVDGSSGAPGLQRSMQAVGLKAPTLPTVGEIIRCNAAFENSLRAGMLCHMGQPSLTESVSNCEHRAIGSGGGFGWRSLRDSVDVALLESAALAHFACIEARPKKAQRARY